MLKRSFDLFVAGVVVILLSPLLAAIAIAILMSSGMPIFYRGERVGRNNSRFRIFKFRTMVPGAENFGGPSTAKNDPRLTRLGLILRRFKLDELPQLLNVLRGEMSIVGPRPQVSRYTDLYEGELLEILSVRPGLTDYASIEFITLDAILGDVDVDNYYIEVIEPRKNTLRLKYVREASLLSDLKIIVITAITLLKIQSLWEQPKRPELPMNESDRVETVKRRDTPNG